MGRKEVCVVFQQEVSYSYSLPTSVPGDQISDPNASTCMI